MQGCHHQARRAKDYSPATDRWVRAPHCLKSRPGPPPKSARASGGGRSRAATPFACGAGTLWRCPAHRHTNDFVPRPTCPTTTRVPVVHAVHGQTKKPSKPQKYHFLRFETAMNALEKMLRQTPASHPDPANLNPNSEAGHEIEPTCREPIAGRARHSVRAAPATSACKISPASPSRPAADQDVARVSRTHFGVRVKPRAAWPET